jgi:hypothetical protein
VNFHRGFGTVALEADMLQFFLKTVTGIIMGAAVWAPIFAALLYFLEGKWGTMQISLGLLSGSACR